MVYRFLTWLLIVAWPCANAKDIVFLEPAGAPPGLTWHAFQQEFQRPELTGYVLKRVPIDLFDTEKLAAQMDAVIAENPSLIVAIASRAASFAGARTKGIPVLFVSLGDPVSLGLVQDPAKPEANLTGFTYRMYDYRKLFEIAAGIVGRGGRAGLVVDRLWMRLPHYRDTTLAVERSVGLKLTVIEEDDAAAVPGRLAKAGKVDVWIVPDTAMSRRGGVAMVEALRAGGAVVVTEVEQHLPAAHVMVAPDIERPLRLLAEMSAAILGGVPVSQFPLARPKRWTIAVNREAIASTPARNWGLIVRMADRFYP